MASALLSGSPSIGGVRGLRERLGAQVGVGASAPWVVAKR
jgi:hypothetical protein